MDKALMKRWLVWLRDPVNEANRTKSRLQYGSKMCANGGCCEMSGYGEWREGAYTIEGEPRVWNSSLGCDGFWGKKTGLDPDQLSTVEDMSDSGMAFERIAAWIEARLAETGITLEDTA